MTLENDASEYGLGSALLQDKKPVAFASRSLIECERKYAQIEKEMLALVYGLEKFHHYTFGRAVHIITDHKPLVAIANKPLSQFKCVVPFATKFMFRHKTAGVPSPEPGGI